MTRVLTNATGVSVARQESRGVLGADPTWEQLEPNDIEELGPEVGTVPRSPISQNRQRRKGVVTSLRSGFSYACDLTMNALALFIEPFLFVSFTNEDLRFRASNVGASGYTIPAATSAQAAKLQFHAAGKASLVYAVGYANTGNNGLKPLTADVTATDTTIQVASNTVETAPANAEVLIAGIRAEAGDLSLAVSGTTGTLSSGGNTPTSQLDFTTLGLTVGQRIHVGGMTDTNRFGSTAAGDGTRSYGSARVRVIAAAALTLDKLDATLVASDGTDDGNAGTPVQVDVLFGRFARNVSVTDSEYLEQYLQFEGSYPDLYETDPPTPVAEPDGFEYALDNLANEMVWELPLEDKATMTMSFVGTDTESPVDNGDRKTNADTPITPLLTGAFSTAIDFMRLRIEDVDESGLTTDFKDVTLTMRNNVEPEPVLGQLGARYINTGNFEVDVEATTLFSNPEVPARIRGSTTVSMDLLLQNDDGAVHADFPSGTLSSDGREFPVNESVRIGLKLETFQDSFFGSSVGVSLFAIYPAE